MKRIIITALAIITALSTFAQNKAISQKATIKNNLQESKLHLGIGMGLDYGGLGLKAEYLPVKYAGIFGGAGYNFLNFGFNVGIQGRPFPDAKVQPIAIAMYGYNGALKIDNRPEVSKAYYGFSAGIGGELRVGKKHNHLYVAVLVPFRNEEFKRNYESVKNDPNVKLGAKLTPITYSIGFNWSL